MHICRIASIYQPTNAHIISHKTLLKHLMFIGPCIILIVEQREINLMSLALLFLHLMLNMFRMLIQPSSGAYDLCVELFHWLYWSGSMCVGVTLWYGCGGVVSVYRLEQYFNLYTDTTPPQPYHNVTSTHIEPDQCNPCNNSTHKSQAPEDGCINIRNMLSIK